MTAVQAASVDAPHCPQCGGELGAQQDWCLRCGRGATTRIVRARHWRIPLALLALLLALAGAGLAVLFVSLSGDDERIVTSGELTTTITVTTQSPAAANPPVTQTTPGTPGATTPTSPTAPATPTTPATPAVPTAPATPPTAGQGSP